MMIISYIDYIDEGNADGLWTWKTNKEEEQKKKNMKMIVDDDIERYNYLFMISMNDVIDCRWW